MGQALYDAQKEFMRINSFYDETSLSPFLIVNDNPVLRRFEANTEPRPVGNQYLLDDLESPPRSREWSSFIVKKYDIETVPIADTIEEVEDHYLNNTITEPYYDNNEWSVFRLNAQSMRNAAISRRGIGWIVLMHPDTFRIIETYPNDPRFDNLPPLWTMRGDFTIGRWTLAATKVDRCHHVWTSSHIPVGEVFTVYRDVKVNNPIDGFAVVKTVEGFRYPELEPAPGGYIVKHMVRI